MTAKSDPLRVFTLTELEDLVLSGDMPIGLTKEQSTFFTDLNDLIEPLRDHSADDDQIEELTDELRTANNVIAAIKKALRDGID